MHRRRFLAAAGVGLAGLAGCLGGSGDGDTATTTAETTTQTTTPTTTTQRTTGEAINEEPTTQATTESADSAGPMHGDDLPSDPTPDDGYPPAFDEQPPAPSADPSSFETIGVDGETVSLAPIDVVYAWYGRGEARFADARGTGQYEKSHVFGAVSSPVSQIAGSGPDPVDDWPTDDRVVCYCGCPHHLSSMRAAELQQAGFEDVYVIDEGFWEWHDRGFPLAGEGVDGAPAAVVVDGVVAPAYAGEYALATHAASGQVEAAPIGSDGRYRLELRFSGVDDATRVAVETPAYRVEAPLGDLAAGVVDGGS